MPCTFLRFLAHTVPADSYPLPSSSFDATNAERSVLLAGLTVRVGSAAPCGLEFSQAPGGQRSSSVLCSIVVLSVIEKGFILFTLYDVLRGFFVVLVFSLTFVFPVWPFQWPPNGIIVCFVWLLGKSTCCRAAHGIKGSR